MGQKAYLILENGQVFEGFRCGAARNVLGELVFTTGVCGYLETLTDPNYYGQIVMQTFPVIGAYGYNNEDVQNKKPYLSAYITRELCTTPSNFRSDGALDAYFEREGIVCLYGIDTRAVTRVIRKQGIMNAYISDSPSLTEQEQEALKTYCVKDAVESIACDGQPCEGIGDKHVVIWNFGKLGGIKQALLEQGVRVSVIPAQSKLEDIVALRPDGLILSDGPGDPMDNQSAIATLKALFKCNIPTMGISLGHQLLALAMGAKTEKLNHGHHGSNHPTLCHKSGRTYITGQNHGYVVLTDTLPAGANVSFTNLNDHTCEGISYTTIPAFSVQFDPVFSKAAADVGFLMDEFIAMVKGGKTNAAQ